MLSGIQMETNKVKFIELLQSIQRPGCNIDKLIEKLESSDWFIAPASTRFHNAFPGGLVQHSLNVYENLCELVKMSGLNYEEDTLKIVGLLHDISKMNFYRPAYRNKKVYSETGSKSDAGGRFDWVTEESYETMPTEERFFIGNHEETSEYMLRYYLPLTVEESVAILHHMGGMSYDSTKQDLGAVFNRYPLALLLYEADMFSSYINEKEHKMNSFVKDQLEKVKIAVIPDFDEKTTSIFIPKTTDLTKRKNSELVVDHYYKIEVEDYIIHPYSGFTLHDNWNNGRVPTDSHMNVEVQQIMGKMVKVEAVGINDKKGWFGWLPIKSIKTFEEL